MSVGRFSNMSVRRWKAIGTLTAGSFGSMAALQPGAHVLPSALKVPHTTYTVALKSASCGKEHNSAHLATESLPGAKHWQPVSESHLAGGGTLYTYSQNGQTVEYPVPPKGFDPLTAPQSELAEYGIPSRPSRSASDFDSWKSLWGSLGTVQTPNVWSVPSGEGVGSNPASPSSVLQAIGSLFGNVQSNNWSGYIAQAPFYKNFTQVTSDTIQSTAVYTNCAHAEESNWVGLGAGEALFGGANGGLIQDGTSIVYRSLLGTSGCGGIGGPCYYAWYEYLTGQGKGPSEINLSNVKIRHGDHIFESVNYIPSESRVVFWILDTTSKTSQIAYLNKNTSRYYDGNTAEFITERPLINNQYLAPLYNYQTSKFYGTSITDYKNGRYAGSGTLGSFAPKPITMVDSNGHNMSSPSTLSSNGNFTDIWHRCN